MRTVRHFFARCVTEKALSSSTVSKANCRFQIPRERAMKRGPRGLGLKVGLDAPDVEGLYQVFKQADCEISAELLEQFWCERLFTAIDPFGYEWEFRQGVKQRTLDEQAEAARVAWVEKR